MKLNTNSILYRTLARALSIKRPHNTVGTFQLTHWLTTHLPKGVHYSIDGAGNLHVDTRKQASNRTLFVAHVDTVHRVIGPNKIRKTADTWFASGAPLGADDGAGVAMLMHLLHGGVCAYYIFTQGEECGGLGATWLAENKQTLLSEFDRAIAFDRKGIDSVITYQGSGRCCSDEFANALADAFNVDERLMYSPDDTGVYTDTAEFIRVIPECTNISIGYYSEHSENERLDIVHLHTLAERCLCVDWDALPTKRDPSVQEDAWSKWESQWFTNYSSYDRTKSSYQYTLTQDEIDMAYALEDALEHDFSLLVELMAAAVYPEDARMAVKFINTQALSRKVLLEAYDMLDTYTPDEILAFLFSQAYCEA